MFAAGLGTRLKPLTDTLPKALVPVGGQPLLWHVLMKLKGAGYRKIVINVHHFADRILDYLAANGNFGLDIRISDERDFLRETGGGICHARPLLEGPDTEPFLVHNVDILSNLDLGRLRQEARPEALATLVVSDRPTRRYLLFDKDMRLAGWTDRSTGEVRSPYDGRTLKTCRPLAFSGIHLVSRGIFDAFSRCGFSGRFPIMDFYLKSCAAYPIYGWVPQDFKMLDVGKSDVLADAENFLAGTLGTR